MSLPYDCFLVDLDGTANVGDTAVPYAVEALNTYATRVVYVTNNASRSPEQVTARLTRLGFTTDPSHVITSAQLGTELLTEELDPGSEVLVLGAPYLEELVAAAGFTTVRDNTPRTCGVIHGHSDHTGWAELSAAARAIRTGARYFATNRDANLPSERGLNVGNGAMVGAVEISTGTTAITAGKPSARSMHKAAAMVSGSHPLVIGDRLDTDIEGGVNAGYDTLCVLTGVTTVTDLCAAPSQQRPTYVAPDLRWLQDDTATALANRLDTLSPEQTASCVSLDYDGGTLLVHVREPQASIYEKLAALINQAWHNNRCISTICGATQSDEKELSTWPNL